MRWVIEQVEETTTEQAAREMLQFASIQHGYINGRILAACSAKPTWRMQAFYEDSPDVQWLPDGLARRLCPKHLLSA